MSYASIICYLLTLIALAIVAPIAATTLFVTGTVLAIASPSTGDA